MCMPTAGHTLGHVKHSMKMMWVCAAIVVVVIALSIAGASAGYALFALPCILMMGAMVWMMTRGMGGGSGGSQEGG